MLFLHDLIHFDPLRSTLYNSTSYSLHSTIYAPAMIYALWSTLCDLRSMIYALWSTLKALIATFIYTIYPLSSTSYSCLLFALYVLRSTLHDLRSTIYALWSAFYDVRSTINVLWSTLYYLLSKDLLQPLFAQSTL